MKCPYCGAEVVIRDASVVYNGRFKGNKLYVCSNFPKCDSYGSYTLANKELRLLRGKCHSLIDPLWRNKIMSRNEVYYRLRKFFNLPKEKTHIALFDKEQCSLLIKNFDEVFR